MSTNVAIFENGVFKPVDLVELARGTRVEVHVPEGKSNAVARLRRRFPRTFGASTKENADELARIIEKEFRFAKQIGMTDFD